MAIAYPISLPAAFSLARITIRQCGTVGESVSPFSAAQQLYEHPGQWWEADCRLPPISRRDDAEDVVAAMMSLRSKLGTFLMGDPLAAVQRGVGGGTPVVDGAGQAGHQLELRGLPLSTTGWLKTGDWLQLGSGATARLHKVLVRVDSDGAGKATLDIWPRLRSAPADSAAVTIAAAKGVWQLASNQFEYDIEPAMKYGIAFSCRERM